MKSIILHFDGTSKPNPGKSACAFVICDETGHEIEKQGRYLGDGTNNIAEYLGLILGLIRVLRYDSDRILIYSDSNLVIQQIRGNYRVKDIDLKKLYIIATEILKFFSEVKIEYIPHEKNIAHSIAQSYLEKGLFD